MVAEYSRNDLQTVSVDGNIVFNNGDRYCRKGLIQHRDDSGIFRIKGASNACRSIYKVQYTGNIAVSAGGTVGPISIALVQNGEVLRNAVATVTVAAIGAFNNVTLSTFIILPCGCCDTISVENISDGTAIDVINSNLIIDRVA